MRWSCRGHAFTIGAEPLIMGVLNVTPDSFSDGGLYIRAEAAVARGLEMIEQGAAIVDVGGESTRPGATPATIDEELRRTIPVVEALRKATGSAISIDTRHAAVAREAVAAGATIVNDVSALTHDEEMGAVVKSTGVGVVLMHMRGNPRTMQQNPEYRDVLGDVRDYLRERLRHCREAGIAADSMVIDPGIGFGKTVQHNLDLLRGIPALAALGRPVLIGLSRKRFLGRLTGRETDDRLAAGVACHTAAVLAGAHVLRAHDVRETRDAVRIATALKEQTE